ncbi:glycosyltransferase family 4 protein [Aquimarina agarilytica]|uniref:glycosyltransferase family 4 protein n=1 Tax=Aquimarina agarilytica TaxID=1087449 RepID=UPI00028829E7|nr:glycosyltransferase family 4 protein [Aquimarina agarilytica]
MSERRNKILIIINTDWFFLLHRIQIVNSFKREEIEIVVAAKDTGRSDEIKKLGFEFVNIDFNRKGVNLFAEINVLIQIFKLYKKYKPTVVYQVTIKPIIYGLLVAKFFKVKAINTICGLGYVFSNENKIFLRRVVVVLYRIAFNNLDSYIFFENKDDLASFIKLNIINSKNNYSVVNGVGVDLKKFKSKKEVRLNSKEKIQVILPSRMLWDKGVREFVKAAIALKSKYKDKVFFKLYGMIDKGNRECIPKEYLSSIEMEGYLEWFDFEEDMISVYEETDIVVLPSYREGLPTVLAEACAMGLPIITTDAVGCRECVDEGINGFKVPVKSVKELKEKIEVLILSETKRLEFGRQSRIKAEKEFDQEIITKEYKKVFDKMYNQNIRGL